ncbi:hypothetical protein [Leeia aquatica]|uniref:Uncharacterized protein n=1 Tax=Leeia aquatica TaxID=2725557 RepID=A0A847SES6_9NEIS|nr:hypothetical protein [Leeia aquatica]NLR75708.1 hypothetical protein [Leeia aquatica]
MSTPSRSAFTDIPFLLLFILTLLNALVGRPLWLAIQSSQAWRNGVADILQGSMTLLLLLMLLIRGLQLKKQKPPHH